MTQIWWLHPLPGAMMLLFLVAALVYATLRRSDQSSAKMLAVTGLGLMLFLRIAHGVVTLAISQWAAASNFTLYHGLYSLVSILIYMLALGFLVAAAFTGRRDSGADEGIGVQRYPVASKNPYTPPMP